MPVKHGGYHLSCGIPAAHNAVVVEQFVDCNGEVKKSRASHVGKASRRDIISKHFTEYFNANSVREELPRRIHISPERHAVLNRSVIVCLVRNPLRWDNIQCLPFWCLLV